MSKQLHIQDLTTAISLTLAPLYHFLRTKWEADSDDDFVFMMSILMNHADETLRDIAEKIQEDIGCISIVREYSGWGPLKRGSIIEAQLATTGNGIY